MQAEKKIPKTTHRGIRGKSSSAFPTIIGLAALIFALDQLTKFLVVQNIPIGGALSIWPPLDRIFRFTFVINTGAAFGMFPQFGNIFTIIALIVIGSIVFFYRYLPTGNIWIRVGLGVQLGGAMGNVLDRLVRGYVVDFIDIGFWPIFNIADLAIVLGVAMLAYHLWDDEAETTDSPTNNRSVSAGGNLP